MNRAFGQLTIKSIDDEAREFSGRATTISPDRQLDIVEPRGARFKLPIPLLSKHDKSQPIGEVFAVRVTDDGIEYDARIPKVAEAGLLKERTDLAWQEIKYGVVRGVSIGFLPVSGEVEPLKTGGYRFKAWDWIELSPVPVPANQEATIQRIKSLAAPVALDGGGEEHSPGAPGSSAHKGSVRISKPKEQPQVNIKEQIAALETKRKELTDDRTALQAKAVAEGRTKDAQERERFDEITVELKSIDQELDDLKELEAEQLKTAAPAAGASQAGGAQSRAGKSAIVVKDNRITSGGIAMAQVVKHLFMAQGNYSQALALAQSNESLDPRVVPFLKAAVAAGTTSNAAWAGNLIQGASEVYADFAEFLRPRTIIGRFGNGGIPALRAVPFRTPLLGQTTGGQGYWVGEGSPKPLTKFDFSRTELTELKVANIAVITEELLRRSTPSADALVRDGLVGALAARLDVDFIDPDKAASAGVSPGSITNGVSPISSVGTSADAVRADLRALWAPFIAASNPPTTAVYLMSATTALGLSLMQNALGQSEFPGITLNGGTLNGVPVITSEYLANDGGSAGGIVALVNASDIYFADEGGFMVDLSREATLQMNDTPDNPTTAATVMVSLWQQNLVGFRAERTVNWARRRAVSVSWLDTVRWGQ